MGSGASYAKVATAKWYFEGKANYGKVGFDAAKSKVFKSDDMPAGCMEGKVVAITGSNQGIGYEAALQCAQLGAYVYLVCRNEGRAVEAADKIKKEAKTENVDTAILDVSELAKVRQFATDFAETLKAKNQSLDVLVNNAGAMPNTRTNTSEGKEAIAASTYGGCLLLSGLLIPSMAKDARIINVSSGGAYSVTAYDKDLDCTATKYDGRLFYAVAKRNQLVITEQMNEFLNNNKKKNGGDISVMVMHPGWADTSAIREAMPEFHKENEKTLRSSAEGADTITFLAGSPKIQHSEHSGKFFFDRQVVPMALPWTGTETSAELKEKVWRACGVYVGGNLPELGL